MWARFQKLPLAISIPTLFILMLMIPSVHGFISGDSHKGRSFFYAVLLGLFGLTFLRFSLQGTVFPMHRHAQLWSLIAFFLGFPLLLAIPLYEVSAAGQFIDAYLDIVSTVTTTGLPVFAPGSLSETLVIWRVTLGWASGFLIWVFAWSIFAPLNLGGFEHLGARGEAMTQTQNARQTTGRLPAEKFWSEALRLGPVYLWITLAAALALLIVSGDPSYALLRAMATIATFGIEIPEHSGAGGVGGEVILALVMLFALSRSTFSTVFARARKWRVTEDPELRVAAGLVLVATLVLIGQGARYVEGLGAHLELVWGAFFTSLSYLTTTGLASDSLPVGLVNLDPVEIILVALAMIGGGVATTAGGIKLLRVFILTGHSRAEVNRLIAPSQVMSGQIESRSHDHHSAMLACVFLVLFILVMGAITLALTVAGSPVKDSLYLTLATVTNTGPLLPTGSGAETLVMSLPTQAKMILAAAMVLGRLEVLALLALLNPDIYR
ncbi:MAG: potassium transporter TrkG [Planktomarina sp.]|jgi:trk system potassium uptake protein|nr:potassium transporter TrkG [Planktomarina sp.]MDG1744500.1 potassium transporter TrkG [Planktomarina sp.]